MNLKLSFLAKIANESAPLSKIWHSKNDNKCVHTIHSLAVVRNDQIILSAATFYATVPAELKSFLPHASVTDALSFLQIIHGRS